MSLCEWLVWGDAYAVALHKELVPFARVMPAHVELVERLLPPSPRTTPRSPD
ncbi:MAG: hypothetical protein ACRDYX_10265 [Egibacteraceae bacterium]